MAEDCTLPIHEHDLSSSDEAETAADDPPARALPLQAVLLEFARNAVRSHGPRAFEVLRHLPPSLPPSLPPYLPRFLPLSCDQRSRLTPSLLPTLASPLPFCQPSTFKPSLSLISLAPSRLLCLIFPVLSPILTPPHPPHLAFTLCSAPANSSATAAATCCSACPVRWLPGR
jgi:hypothetical protein